MSNASPLGANSDFLVLDASAGSGKTYSLVQHILLNALRTETMPNAYQKVLAITFTNNAAEEMKARLLSQLVAFMELSKPAESDFFKPIWELLNIAPEALQQRARRTASHMLHNYSALSVGTIDQFTHRLVRTFTRDLDLDDNFEVSLDLDAMVAEALDLLYSALSEDPQLRASLVNLVQDRMRRDKGFNPDFDLKTEGKNAFEEQTWRELRNLPSPERMAEIEVELNEKLDRIIAEGKAISDAFKAFLKTGSFTKNDIKNLDLVEKNVVGTFANLRGSKFTDGVKTWKAHTDGAYPEFDALMSRAYAFKEAYTLQLPLLKQATEKLQNLSATRALLEKFNELQRDQNTMPLSAFNRLIFEELQKEPAGFIYARLGEKYWHFYIDEFQDTSEIQFNNLHPLIEHSLTKDEQKNSALIVGDAKQSIYRWRGGRAEQFLELVQNTHPINRYQGHPDGHELYPRETVKLGRNFRTHGAIVDFNNRFFPDLAKGLTDPQHRAAYSAEGVFQHPHKDEDRGEVRVDFLLSGKEKSKKEDIEPVILEQTKARIDELRNKGWGFSDIAILTRGNKEGKKVAQFLVTNGYPVLSGDSLIVGQSYESKILVACAQLHLQPNHRESLFELAYALGKLGKAPVSTDPFTFQYNVVHNGLRAAIKHYPLAAKLLQPQSSLYSFGAQVFHAFDLLLEPNAMVDACLDLLYTFQNKGGSFSNLPQWWTEETANRSVPAPENMPAIKVMTIHKSKGLEFEHVLIPFSISDFEKTSEHWIDVDLHAELGRFPISKTNDNRDLFNDAQWNAIENESYFDWMNMVYVALTRPVAGLHLFFNGDNPDTLGKAVREHLGLDSSATIWRKGTAIAPAHEAKGAIAVQNTPNPAAFHPSHLRMANTAPEGWFQGHTDAAKWGSAMHRILQIPQEVRPTALLRLHRTGQFSSALQERAAQLLIEMENHAALSDLNDPNTIIYTERSIGDPEHGTLRPDLILLQGTRCMVIDYKTGHEKPKYREQLERYKEALRHDFSAVDGELLYL
ncbi:MAG: hypothetical protein RL754_944 [Bacteroidota bacterium]